MPSKPPSPVKPAITWYPPSSSELALCAREIPEIDVPSVETLLYFLAVSKSIQSEIMNTLERDHGFSPGKLRVMMPLLRHPEGIEPSRLAEIAGVTRATISILIKRMTRDGLVGKALQSQDGRRRPVTLTEKGRAMLKAILPEHYAKISEYFSPLDAKEREVFIELLKKIQN